MSERKTSTLGVGLIWFGAGVSIAEIMTGTLLAPLGFTRGLCAIILGHLIGCALLYLVARIGAQSEMTAMETARLSFGRRGGSFFAVLNVVQLIGWTAVMIVGGSAALRTVLHSSAGFEAGHALCCLLIGALIAVWLLLGLRRLTALNLLCAAVMFLLTVAVSLAVFRGEARPVAGEIGFGAAVELAVAMPLSWLPLAADYTRQARRPRRAAAIGSVVYFFVSSWMYAIGLGAMLFLGESEAASMMLAAGLGLLAAVAIVLATVTTTFLDAYSAGVSLHTVSRRLPATAAAVAVCALGTVLAVWAPVTQYESFLYLIGSVFAPMAAILIADFFLLKKNHLDEVVSYKNGLLWLAGFALYRLFMQIETPVGSTLPVMLLVVLLCLAVHFAGKRR